MKNLLKMSDLSPAELTHILDVADQLKAQQKLGGTAPLLAGKTVALIFSKASTRTRTSFEVGVYQLGGLGNYMNTAELQAGRGEPLRDTARVLGRYYDCAVRCRSCTAPAPAYPENTPADTRSRRAADPPWCSAAAAWRESPADR